MYMLLVADQILFRDGIKMLLQKSNHLSRSKEATCLSDSLNLLESETFDLIVLDILLKDAIGLDALRKIKRQTKNTPVLTITDETDVQLAQLAITYGSTAHVTKSTSLNNFVKAIDCINSGHIYLSPELTSATDNRTTTGQISSDLSIFSSLSDRQREVLHHLAKGNSNKSISEKLNISQNTVKAHLATIFKILGVHNRTEAIYFIARAGFPLE